MSLTVIGNGEFGLIGTPRWIPGGFGELDALELTYQGAYDKLNAFLAGLSKWSASPLDASMFLESFPSDGDPVKPKVTKRFIGFRNGQLPVGKRESGQTVQSATSTKVFSNLGKDVSFTAEIVYYSPMTSYTSISTSKGGTGAEEPSGLIQIIDARVNNVAISGEFRANVLSAYFKDQITSVTHSEELVPDRYWRNTNTKQKIKVQTALALT